MQMTTAFLRWTDLGCLFAANDPIDNEKKWIVEKSNGEFRYQSFWVKNNSKQLISGSDILTKTQWDCVIRCIEHAVNNAHYDAHPLSEKSKSFLQSLRL